MSDKRIVGRSLCADLIELEWLDERGEVRALSGVLEDISARGACLQVESPVPVKLNALVRHGENWVVPCQTAYCVFREIGYFVGIEFDADAPWSEMVFHPQHLLDLRELVSRNADE